MKKLRILSLLLLLCLCAALCLPFVAATESGETSEPESNSLPPFSVEAKAAILIDLNNDRVIFSQNSAAQIYPASLTKIMTCLIALEQGDLSDVVTVSESAFNGLDGNSSSSGLQVGEQLTLENALYCLMIASGNESANVVAEHIAGSVNDFVRMMNERAHELGCTNTHFANPHGLHDESHFTTVDDLVRITQAALKSETFKVITNTAEYTLPATNLSDERQLETTNQLINNSTSNAFYYPRAKGIKTGFTTPAGRCLISTAEYDGLRFLAIVCGAGTTLLETGDVQMESFPQCIRLFKYGFENFSYKTIVSPLYPVTQIAVRNSGASEVVSLAPEKEIRLLLPTNYEPSLVRIEPVLPAQFTEAPVSAGAVFGTVRVYFDDELLGETNLCAINDVPRSEILPSTTPQNTYVQRDWWQWVVIVILLLIATLLVWLLYLQLRRRRERARRMEARRRAIEQRRRQIHIYNEFDDEE